MWGDCVLGPSGELRPGQVMGLRPVPASPQVRTSSSLRVPALSKPALIHIQEKPCEGANGLFSSSDFDGEWDTEWGEFLEFCCICYPSGKHTGGTNLWGSLCWTVAHLSCTWTFFSLPEMVRNKSHCVLFFLPLISPLLEMKAFYKRLFSLFLLGQVEWVMAQV